MIMKTRGFNVMAWLTICLCVPTARASFWTSVRDKVAAPQIKVIQAAAKVQQDEVKTAADAQINVIAAQITAPAAKLEASNIVQQASIKLSEAIQKEAELKKQRAQLEAEQKLYSGTALATICTTILGIVTTWRAGRSGKLDNLKKELEITKLREEIARLRTDEKSGQRKKRRNH